MPSSSLMPVTRAVGTYTPQKDAHTFTLALADIAVVGRQNEHPCWDDFLGSSFFLRPFPSAAVALRDNKLVLVATMMSNDAADSRTAVPEFVRHSLSLGISVAPTL